MVMRELQVRFDLGRVFCGWWRSRKLECVALVNVQSGIYIGVWCLAALVNAGLDLMQGFAY